MTPAPPRRAARRRGLLAALALAVAGAVAATAAAAIELGAPARAYLDLRAATAKATSAEAVLPLLSANYRRVVSNLPRVERDDWFLRFKRFPPSPVTVQAQAQAGDRCALGAVARDAAHVKWSGRIEMLREGGAWKLDDESWTSEHR
jgi:hypothetical protein